MKRRGFTLIELLVVIAIIGILAAMVFPVFARARESARKVVCLSNLKNIALAMQMYLGDYDAFPPGEHRQDVIDYYNMRGGGDCGLEGAGSAPSVATHVNPYLRWPVVFDEYVRNRDVWRCPSAQIVSYAAPINPCLGDWFRVIGPLGIDGCCSCGDWWPSGWGGDLTDSTTGGTNFIGSDVVGNKVFELDYGMPTHGTGSTNLRGMKLAAIAEPTKLIVVADACKPDPQTGTQIAYPEVCRAQKWDYYAEQEGGWTCASNLHEEGWITQFWSDPSFRKQYARHLGGDNLAFADGHARWMPAEAILNGLGDWKEPHPELEPFDCLCDLSDPNSPGNND